MIAESNMDDYDSSDYEKNLKSNWNHELRDLFEADIQKYGQVM